MACTMQLLKHWCRECTILYMTQLMLCREQAVQPSQSLRLPQETEIQHLYRWLGATYLTLGP